MTEIRKDKNRQEEVEMCEGHGGQNREERTKGARGESKKTMCKEKDSEILIAIKMNKDQRGDK